MIDMIWDQLPLTQISYMAQAGHWTGKYRFQDSHERQKDLESHGCSRTTLEMIDYAFWYDQ